MLRLSIMTITTTIFFMIFACSQDDDENSTPAADSTSGESESTQGRPNTTDSSEMGPGCYSGPPEHSCDCSIEESACTSPQTWTDQCPCGPSNDEENDGSETPSTDEPQEETTANNNPNSGCYSPVSHTCDCEGDADACSESGGVWTEMCECGDEGDGDADTPSDSSDANDATNANGCYSPVSHQCDCETDENSCADSGGLWTDMCACGATETTDEDESASGGCYSGPPEHSCDCDLTEDACTESGGAWTDRCEC